MKALTIRQPWASLIMLGVKTIETRSWATNFRGELAIHAGQAWGPAERQAAREAVPLPYLEAAGLDPDHLPCAVVLGTVILWDCRPVAKLYDHLHSRAGARDRMLGNFERGRYGWMLRMPRAFARPVPAKGALSFWTWRGR